MKSRWSLWAGLVTLAILLAGGANGAAAGDGKVYGEPLTGTEITPIAELLSNPESYLDEVVRVEGVVSGVCKKRGCWMTIASEDEDFQEIRIKVTDGVIVFPMEAKGRLATAEGIFTKIEMSLEQTVKYRQHHAEEHGEAFDPASVKEPLIYYQIKGTGAIIR